jgi:hypothetical protein
MNTHAGAGDKMCHWYDSYASRGEREINPLFPPRKSPPNIQIQNLKNGQRY